MKRGDKIFEAQMEQLNKRKEEGEAISLVDRMRPYVEYQQRMWLNKPHAYFHEIDPHYSPYL